MDDLDGDDLVLPDEIERHEVDDRRVDLDVLELDDLDAHLRPQGLADLGLGAELELHEHGAHAAAAHLLHAQTAVDLLLGHQASLDQDLPQPPRPRPPRLGRHDVVVDPISTVFVDQCDVAARHDSLPGAARPGLYAKVSEALRCADTTRCDARPRARPVPGSLVSPRSAGSDTLRR